MKRRDFIKSTGAGLVGLSFGGKLKAAAAQARKGAAAGRPVLVVIYLRGGIDPLNVVVPYSDKRYYEIRPTIAIPAEDSNESAGVVKLDDRFGLHPALGALKPLFDAKRFAPIINVGSHHPTRSHFDAQDFMEYAAPGLKSVRDGWLNRYLATSGTGAGKGAAANQDAELRAVAVQGLLPRSLRGGFPVLAAPERPEQKTEMVLDFYGDLYREAEGGGAGGMSEEVPEMAPRRRKPDVEDAVLASGQATIKALETYLEILRSAEGKDDRASYPPGRLGPKLKAVASVIRSHPGFEVAALDWNGWDHHAGQGGLEGRQAEMLSHLGGSLAAFLEDLGEHGERTLVLAMSEFGRTCSENGNAGTDHGHGGLMLALGGPVKGGKVLGKWEGLEERHLYESRDLPVTTDFRDVMHEVLETHMRFKIGRDFFPDFKRGRSLGLV